LNVYHFHLLGTAAGYKDREKDQKRKKSKLDKNQPSHKKPKEQKVTTYTIILVEGTRDASHCHILEFGPKL
jgi:hypothetical protein